MKDEIEEVKDELQETSEKLDDKIDENIEKEDDLEAAGSRVEKMRKQEDVKEAKKVEEELYQKEDKLYEGKLRPRFTVITPFQYSMKKRRNSTNLKRKSRKNLMRPRPTWNQRVLHHPNPNSRSWLQTIENIPLSIMTNSNLSHLCFRQSSKRLVV